MPFVINEDQALKDHLSGLTVSDQNDASRPVKVWYRLPEPEERPITYPFITIDLIDIEEEVDRAHRGIMPLAGIPEGATDPGASQDLKTEWPIPVSLVYQVTTFTRSAWHDRQLLSKMLGDKIPFRYGFLAVNADEDDNWEGTVRRMDLLDMSQSDTLDQNNKRVFRKAYTIAVSSQLYPGLFDTADPVDEVDITLYDQLEPYVVAEI